MIRAALAAACYAVLAACAHVEPPPGGPQDTIPAALLTTRPGPDALVPGWRDPVVLVFDERISERGIDQAVEVSPRTSPVAVSHAGDELRVRLREGWLPGTIYHVTVLPVLRDLFGNTLEEPIRLVFSTGPEIPDTRAAGVAVDRTTGEPQPDLRVEAIRTADSLVYATVTDSAGRFEFARVPTGEYLLRAYEDLNRNRALDAFETRDSASVTLEAGDSARARLSVVLPDSTPPVIASAQVDGRVLEIGFDDFLDPEQTLSPGQVSVRDPSGLEVAVTRVAVGRLTEPEDTAAGAAVPSRTLVVELEDDMELEPGTEYTITVSNVRNIVGLAGDAGTTLTPPTPPEGPEAPQPDTASASPNPNSSEP